MPGPSLPDADADARSDAATPTPDATADTGATADQYASLYCGLLAPCCGALNLPTDGAPCRAAVAALAVQPYRATMADACLAALRAASATATFCTAGFAASAPTCERVFSAVIAGKRPGEPCTQNEHCLLSPMGPVSCAGAPGMMVCQVKVPGQEGDGPCVATVGGPLSVPAGDPSSGGARGYLCHVADGLWCEDTTGKCTRSKPPGAACTSFGECGAGNYCDDVSGKCAARKGQGAVCTVDEECPTTICGEDNKCAAPPLVDAALSRLCVRP